VFHNLQECTEGTGFLSQVGALYTCVRSRALMLKHQTVSLNVWHPLCEEVFFAAHPASSHLPVHRMPESTETGAPGDDTVLVLATRVLQPIEWTVVCPSVSMNSRHHRSVVVPPRQWAPAELSRSVPVYCAMRKVVALVQALVNVNQVEMTRGLENALSKSEPVK
jgi:hypothetical protein